jgi:hypothetical protein
MAHVLVKLHSGGVVKLHDGSLLRWHLEAPGGDVPPGDDDDILLIADEEEADMPVRFSPPVAVCSAATTAPAVVYVPMKNGARLLVAHHITGSPGTGGYVSVEIGDIVGGVFVPHHGEGTNIPTGNETSSYSAILRNCGPVAKLTTHITDGTHSVWYQVLA